MASGPYFGGTGCGVWGVPELGGPYLGAPVLRIKYFGLCRGIPIFAFRMKSLGASA